MTALEIIEKYITFFEKRGHKRIPNSPLVPENDPTTLFTSSGMQPLVPYLLGKPHPLGKRLVNVQNCFRAQDIDEVGDNRHTTFFRMLGNWSLGDYFKKEQLQWCFEFLTKELSIPPQRLYVSIFKGDKDFNIPRDEDSVNIWEEIFEDVGINPKSRIFYYDASKNWWSRAGLPEDMPEGEPGGSDSEVFYDFETPHNTKYGKSCHPNCNCGRFLEIGNSVFMEYKKRNGKFGKLPQKNVDFGGGLERLLATVENQSDIFQTSLFAPIIKSIEKYSERTYKNHANYARIVADHFVASVFIANADVIPSNKEHGYILRRLIRRGLDNFYQLNDKDITPIIESVIEQYLGTDKELKDNFEKIKNIILLEKQTYKKTLEKARSFIAKKYKKTGDELMGVTQISAEDAFILYTTHGLSPTQIKSLGFVFNEREFTEKMKKHQRISRQGAEKKFKGGLADHSENTIKGHTVTHLLHRALKDVLGDSVCQTGSNITAERIRFDFSHPQNLTDEELKKVEDLVNEKIKEDLPVTSEVMDKKSVLQTGALGFFTKKYGDKVTVYSIGPSTSHSTLRDEPSLREPEGSSEPRTAGSDSKSSGRPFSVEICGGPHVDFTGRLKRFKIIKQENIGGGNRRIYAKVEN